jgi:hypothetical protein
VSGEKNIQRFGIYIKPKFPGKVEAGPGRAGQPRRSNCLLYMMLRNTALLLGAAAEWLFECGPNLEPGASPTVMFKQTYPLTRAAFPVFINA